MEVDKGLFSKKGKNRDSHKNMKGICAKYFISLVNEGISKILQSLKEFKVPHIGSQIKSA